MNATFVECPQCRGKALSVATRCPHCGYHYPSQPIHRSTVKPDFGRLGPLLAVAGVLVAATVLVVAVTRRAPAGPVTVEAQPAQPVDTASSGGPPPAVTDSAPAAEPAASNAPSSAPSTVPSTSAPSSASLRAEEPAAASDGLERYARTWTHVRDGRTLSAASVRVLNPGDKVLVDSLRQGWYRVSIDGQAIGYVHRSALSAAESP